MPGKPTLEHALAVSRRYLAAFGYAVTRGNWRAAKVHRAITWHLEAVERGEITRLWIRTPPRHGKSSAVSRLFVPWYLGRHPDREVLLATHTKELADDLGIAIKDHIGTDEYKAIFPAARIRGRSKDSPKEGEGAMGSFRMSAGGMFSGGGVRKKIPGKGADLFVIDDPIGSSEEADSPTTCRRNLSWYATSARTRLSKIGAIVGIDTSWGEAVLGSQLIRTGRWHVLNLPAILEEGDDPPCCEHGDWRKPGEALWPERWSEPSMRDLCQELLELDPSIGPRAWETLFQQRAVSLEGEIIKRDWTREEYISPPDRFDRILIYVDPELSGKSTGSWCVALAWGMIGPRFYLLPTRVRIRADFPVVLDAIRGFMRDYPDAPCYFEPTATGPAAASTLSRELPGVLLDEAVRGGKSDRLMAVAPYFEAGNVIVPCRKLAPWIDEWRMEVTSCPHGRSDDYVDATSGGIRKLQGARRVSGFTIPTADQPDYWTPGA